MASSSHITAIPGKPTWQDTKLELMSVVELSLQGRNLLDMDVLSKSDPMCVVYHLPFGGTFWKELTRTECIMNTLNPDFETKVTTAYRFEEAQQLRFELYDLDSDSPNLAHHDFMGSAECTLSQIVTAGVLVLQLQNEKMNLGKGKAGSLVITCEEMGSSKDELELQFVGRDIDRKSATCWGGSFCSPFLAFYKSNESGRYTLVHRTEVVKRTSNPNWKKFKVPVNAVCNGDYDRSIKVEVYHWKRNGSHRYIGEFSFTMLRLSLGPGPNNIYHCTNPKNQHGTANDHMGLVHLLFFNIETKYSFLDYVRGGTQINCTFAIDFTASNGNPLDPDSLHFINPHNMNPYEKALTAVGEIIEDYDTDKLFPVLGFGARIPPDGRVAHEFFVNLHPESPYCERIKGVLEAYRCCIRHIQLHGPTNFAPVINHVARIASNVQDGSEYFILLVITDGIICDMETTKEAIVRASVLPLSIIIIGVGNTDFSAMIELDGDVVPITSKGRKVARDIVQFVPFRNFEKYQGHAVRHQLAKEVLQEIPDQFLSYMRSKGITPKSPTYKAIQMPPDPEKMVL